MVKVFSNKLVRGSFDTIVKHTLELAAELEARDGEPVEVAPAMNKLTLQIIVSVAFGSSLTDEERTRVFKATRLLLTIGFNVVNLTALRFLPFPIARKAQAAVAEIKQTASAIVERRRAHHAGQRQDEGAGADGADGSQELIDVLLSAVDEETGHSLSDGLCDVRRT